MLHRKLLRDLLAWRAQLVAIAMIVACGIAAYVAMQSVYESLLSTKDGYYDRYRFSHVFANLTRAPEDVAQRIARINGVASVQTRVVEDVTADLPQREDAVTVRLISVPEERRPALNDLYLRSGRYIQPNAPNEAIVSEAFADANALHIGDRIAAIINRRLHTFRIVGVALSPEYVYEIRGATDIWPDNRHFGLLWVGRKALAAAFDLTGAFNSVSVGIAPRANVDTVVEDIDRILARYGSLGAIPARDQASNRFLSDELAQLRVQSIFIPLIFLSIAAFLLNIALSRLIASQREQIAILKALGISNAVIALHYMEAVAVIMGAGAVAGTALGAWLGWRLTVIYTHFFHFPMLSYQLSGSVTAAAIVITAGASLAGALQGLRRAVRLPPAEAMRPASPPIFRPTIAERLGLTRWLSPVSRMLLRNIERKPVASAITALAVSFAVAILVVGRYGNDAVQYMIDLQFRSIQREDVTLTFTRPLSSRVRFELAALPGVREVEPFRAVYVRLSGGHRSRRVAVLGLPRSGRLYRIVDVDSQSKEIPLSGLLLSKKLAQLIGARAGAPVDMQVLEERRIRRTVRVAATVDDVLGLNAYMNDDALHRFLDEDRTISGAYLTVDPRRMAEFDRRIKATPAIAGVAYRESALRQFERTIAESMGISISFLIGFAAAIAAGVIYNAGRIAVSERGRELSTLRVLGFTRGEVARILLGEQTLMVIGAIPTGCLLGYLLCKALQPMYETEVYRVPLVISPMTYAFATIVVLIVAAGSNLLVQRVLNRLNLLAVLKGAD